MRLMASIKHEFSQLIENLPDNISPDELLYHVYIKSQVMKGMEQVRGGKKIAQSEIEAEIEQWLK